MATWSELSNEIPKTVQAVGKSVISVQAEGNRTVSGIVLDEHTIVTTASVINRGEKFVFGSRQISRLMRASSAEIVALSSPSHALHKNRAEWLFRIVQRNPNRPWCVPPVGRLL